MCRNTEKTFQINKNRRIGKVLIIVEGKKDEVKCFKEIFHRIFKYRTLRVTQNNIVEYKGTSSTNNSTVIIANAKSTQIKTILEPDSSLTIVRALQKELGGRTLNNCRVYYIWDRDNKSNTPNDIKNAVKKFHDPWGNDEVYENGLLLLSYLCYEAYLISNFEGDIDFIGAHPKEYIKGNKKRKYKPTYFTEKTVATAAKVMKDKLSDMGIKLELDDMENVNRKIFNNEESVHKINNEDRLLSEISMMLLDLGLIGEVESSAPSTLSQ